MTRYEKQVLSRLYNRWLVAQLIRRISDNPEAQQEDGSENVADVGRGHKHIPRSPAAQRGRTHIMTLDEFLAGREPFGMLGPSRRYLFDGWHVHIRERGEHLIYRLENAGPNLAWVGGTDETGWYIETPASRDEPRYADLAVVLVAYKMGVRP